MYPHWLIASLEAQAWAQALSLFTKVVVLFILPVVRISGFILSPFWIESYCFLLLSQRSAYKAWPGYKVFPWCKTCIRGMFRNGLRMNQIRLIRGRWLREVEEQMRLYFARTGKEHLHFRDRVMLLSRYLSALLVFSRCQVKFVHLCL